MPPLHDMIRPHHAKPTILETDRIIRRAGREAERIIRRAAFDAGRRLRDLESTRDRDFTKQATRATGEADRAVLESTNILRRQLLQGMSDQALADMLKDSTAELCLRMSRATPGGSPAPEASGADGRDQKPPQRNDQ